MRLSEAFAGGKKSERSSADRLVLTGCLQSQLHPRSNEKLAGLRGAPSLRQRELVLTAPVLRFDLGRSRLAGTGGFALRAKGLEVTAAHGAYEADSARVRVAEGVVLDRFALRIRTPRTGGEFSFGTMEVGKPTHGTVSYFPRPVNGALVYSSRRLQQLGVTAFRRRSQRRRGWLGRGRARASEERPLFRFLQPPVVRPGQCLALGFDFC